MKKMKPEEFIASILAGMVMFIMSVLAVSGVIWSMKLLRKVVGW